MAEITREKAMDMAVKYLSFKSRTNSEMVEYLKKKNVEECIIADVMQKLGEYRYIDDVVYLKNYVENNRNLNYYGSRRMIQDLKKRGISDQLLLSLEGLFSHEDEYQCGELVAKKNLRALKGQNSVQKKKKLYDKLGRMGYPTEMILDIIRSLDLEEEPQELSANELAYEEQKLSEKLNRDYQKYLRVHRRKGAVGKELLFKIKKSLMGRGYPYALIDEKLEEKREEMIEE